MRSKSKEDNLIEIDFRNMHSGQIREYTSEQIALSYIHRHADHDELHAFIKEAELVLRDGYRCHPKYKIRCSHASE